MTRTKGAGAKTRLAVLAAMPYPTPQGSQVFIGSLVYALKAAGHDVTFHTYPITDERLTPGENMAHGPSPLEQLIDFKDQLTGQLGLEQVSQQVNNQLNNLGLGQVTGQIKGQIKDQLDGFSQLAGRFSPQLLRSGPSVAKVSQDLYLFKETLEQLRHQRPELLYVHNYEALAMGLPLGMMLNVPVLYHAHNIMSQELPSYFKSLQTKLLAMLGGKALDFLPALANQLLFFSQQQAELLEGRIIADEKLNIIPPGLLAKEPEDLFWNTKTAAASSVPAEPYFLYTGNCDNYQNLELLLNAFGTLENPPFKLVLCSSTPVPESAGNNKNIICQPMESAAQLKALLQKAQALVVPRKVAFGFPIKVLQAMRAGLPIIGLKGSLSQLLLPHEALLVDNKPEALAAAMQKIANSPALRTRLSRQAKITFNERFTLEKQVKQYEYIFERTIKNFKNN